MDLKKLIRSNKLTKSIEKFVNDNYSEENMYIGSLILYIYFFSKYKPQNIIQLVKKPIVLICILGYILYVFNTNVKVSILMAIALILTITTEEEDIFLKNVHNNTMINPIINRENFTGNNDEDDEDNEDNKMDEEDEDDNSDDDQVDNNNEDDSDDDDDDDDESDYNDTENYKRYTSENFSKHGIIPNNNMKDTFKNLHDAIHNLENFMNSNK